MERQQPAAAANASGGTSATTSRAPRCPEVAGLGGDSPIEVAVERHRAPRRFLDVEPQAVELHHARVRVARLHLHARPTDPIEDPRRDARSHLDAHVGPLAEHFLDELDITRRVAEAVAGDVEDDRQRTGAGSATFSTSSSVLTGTNVMSAFNSGGQLGQIRLVARRQNEGLDAVPPGGEGLLANAADRQHQPAQRDLTGHRDVFLDDLIPDRPRESPSPSSRPPTGRLSESRPRGRGRADRGCRGNRPALPALLHGRECG